MDGFGVFEVVLRGIGVLIYSSATALVLVFLLQRHGARHQRALARMLGKRQDEIVPLKYADDKFRNQWRQTVESKLYYLAQRIVNMSERMPEGTVAAVSHTLKCHTALGQFLEQLDLAHKYGFGPYPTNPKDWT